MSSPASNTPKERHAATSSAWRWLEHGDGARRSMHSKDTIRQLLQALDAEFIAWEQELRAKEKSRV